MLKLLSFHLRYNRIATIESGAFIGLTNLKFIDLAYNNLTQLDSSIFSGCLMLETIFLFNNPNLNRTNLQSLCPTAAIDCKVYV